MKCQLILSLLLPICFTICLTQNPNKKSISEHLPSERDRILKEINNNNKGKTIHPIYELVATKLVTTTTKPTNTTTKKKTTTKTTSKLFFDKNGIGKFMEGKQYTYLDVSTTPFQIVNDENINVTDTPPTRNSSIVKRELLYSRINFTKTQLGKGVTQKEQDSEEDVVRKPEKNKFSKDLEENFNELLKKSITFATETTTFTEVEEELTDGLENGSTTVNYKDMLLKSVENKRKMSSVVSAESTFPDNDEGDEVLTTTRKPLKTGKTNGLKSVRPAYKELMTNSETSSNEGVETTTRRKPKSSLRNFKQTDDIKISNLEISTSPRPQKRTKLNSISEDDSTTPKDILSEQTLPKNIRDQIESSAQLFHDELQSAGSSDSNTCELDESERSRVENIFPFIVLEPVAKMKDPDGNEYNIWCEGIMISNVWGLAPPKCFIEADLTASRNNDYYINVNEINSTITRTYIATIQTFVPNHLIYIRDSNVLCNNIGLFKILNFNFYFKNLIPLPQVHFRGDLTENLRIEECKLVGAEFLDTSIQFNVASFPLMDVRKYCTDHQTCSAASCVYYNYNMTYLEMNVPRSRAETGCRFDIGYQWGTSLICLDSNDHWIYYGMATSEAKIFCGSPDRQGPGYQAFTRVDAYLKWIHSIINANGGWNPA